jgi:hypothetical protein
MNAYLVWSQGEGESESDGVEINAFDEGDAAEDWAKQRDRDLPNYRISDGFGVRVRVRDIAAGTESTWALSAELEPIYSADKVEDEA